MPFPTPTAVGQTYSDVTLGDYTSVELVTGVFVWDKDGTAATTDKIWLSIIDSTTTLENECYQVGALTAPLSPTVSLDDGEQLRVWDVDGITATHSLTLLPSGTFLRYKNPSTGIDFAGIDNDGLVMDDPTIFNDLEVIKNSDGSYSVDFDPQVIGQSKIVNINPVQTTDFTAVAGADGVEELWPVDVSANTTISTLNITAPITATAGDRFSIADDTLSCTLNRTIRINFNAHPLMTVLTPPDFAEINSAGAKITFTYIDTLTGWQIASNVNA